jgi:hypothetical protein
MTRVNNGMRDQDEKPVSVRPPLKTVGHWITILILPSLIAGPIIWCQWSTSWGSGGWGWLALPGGIWLIGVLLLAFLSQGIYGATADSAGLTLEKAWQRSSRQHMAWSTVNALTLAITPVRKGRVRYVVELEVQDGQTARLVECPYDVPLLRAILSRAQLELREAPEDLRAMAQNRDAPFEAIERLQAREQRWYWTRS